MTEPARNATLSAGARPLLGRLGGAHVRAHGDVHADEAGGGGEHAPIEEAEGRPPAELVVEAEDQERDDRDDRDRHVLAPEVGGGALLDGARDLPHPLVAGRLLEHPVGQADAVARSRRRADQREQHGVVGEEVHLPPALTKFGAARLVSGRSARTSGDAAGSRSARSEAQSRRHRLGGGVGERQAQVREQLPEVAQHRLVDRPSSGGSSAAIASIARRAWSRSPPSSLAYASWRASTRVESRSSTSAAGSAPRASRASPRQPRTGSPAATCSA